MVVYDKGRKLGKSKYKKLKYGYQVHCFSWQASASSLDMLPGFLYDVAEARQSGLITIKQGRIHSSRLILSYEK